MTTAYINGIGLIGPGFNDWASAAPILAGAVPYQPQKTIVPAPSALPAAERRRCGPIVKLSIAVGYQAAEQSGDDVSKLATVFTASGGDGANCHEICQMLASSDRQISPTRFHNSVHNAAAGYWGIAAKAMAPSAVMCAYDGSFGAGLLEAVAQVAADKCAVLLIACDTTYPEPLFHTRPIPDEMGLGMVLSPQPGSSSLARIDIDITVAEADQLGDPALEALRTAIPVARSLPLLQAVAQKKAGTLVLNYLDNTRIEVRVAPCA
ncbi:MAG: hypothetical protein K0S28_1633 [Paucimonas sp.]|jgi:hypothetical protein|nr:hypothetical protein [Paucimonas sp.]